MEIPVYKSRGFLADVFTVNFPYFMTANTSSKLGSVKAASSLLASLEPLFAKDS